MGKDNWQLSVHEDRIVDEDFALVATVHQPGAGRILTAAPALLDIVRDAKVTLSSDEPDFLLRSQLLERINAMEDYLLNPGVHQAVGVLGSQMTPLASAPGQDSEE